jgi:hypothetical protein
MRWLVVLLLGLTSLAQASEARACSCMRLSPSEGLSSSHAVFTGEVIEIQPNQATRFGGLEITLRVERVWKGDPKNEIKVHTAGSSAACGYSFVEGKKYLVYALRDDADPMRVSLCSRTALVEDAKEDLDFLGKPSHQFEDWSRRRNKDKCAAAPGNTDGPGFGLLALVLIGAVLAVRRLPHLLLLGALAVSLVGCKTTPAKPALMANMAKDDLTVYQLRAMDYEYAAQFAQLVAVCVLDIVAHSDDKHVIDRVYQWRMWASPQARAAAFDQDPFAGLLELWVLASQQRHYFAEGGGKSSFGDQRECALKTTRHLEQEAELLASRVMSVHDLRITTESVREWVDDHPIEGQLFVRPSARADLAGLVPQEKYGGLQAVGSMEETLRDLSDRMTILTVQMPVEGRWQAEYLAHALFEDRMQDPADSVVDAMEDITAFLGEFEGALSAQTATLLDGFAKERLAVFDALGEERAEILSAIEQKRLSIMTSLDEQLISATAELGDMGRGLIDHFFVRLIEVLAVMGVVMILTVLLVLVALRKRGTSND